MCQLCVEFGGNEHHCMTHHGWNVLAWCNRCVRNLTDFARATGGYSYQALAQYEDLVAAQVAAHDPEEYQLAFPFAIELPAPAEEPVSAEEIAAALRLAAGRNYAQLLIGRPN